MVMDKIALTLLIIGGLNWGSVGLFQFDLVAFACGGAGSLVSRVVSVSYTHLQDAGGSLEHTGLGGQQLPGD